MKSMDVGVSSGGSTNKHYRKNKQLKMEEMKFCNRILEIENSFLHLCMRLILEIE
jgi:hypothetical protein